MRGAAVSVSHMSYSKLHSSIVNSSLWTQGDSVRILFVTLLAMCDRDGIVYGSRAGLTRIAMIEADDEEEAWKTLMSEDLDSSDKIRAPENGGRRVEEVSGGFRLLNFEYYRGLRNDDERREQNRQAQARFKAKVSQGKPAKATVSHGNPPKAHTEADTEADKNPPTPLRGKRARAPFVWRSVLAEFPTLDVDVVRSAIEAYLPARKKAWTDQGMRISLRKLMSPAKAVEAFEDATEGSWQKLYPRVEDKRASTRPEPPRPPTIEEWREHDAKVWAEKDAAYAAKGGVA